MDSDGDGIGDFAGLSQRLSYLAGLGVICVWLLPFSRTPNRDNGYDVQDYYSVDPKHGRSAILWSALNYAHSLGIRVVVDLVVNHTSDQHEWFQEARKDKRSPKRDW